MAERDKGGDEDKDLDEIGTETELRKYQEAYESPDNEIEHDASEDDASEDETEDDKMMEQ